MKLSLIAVLAISGMGLAYAETGQNFDRELLAINDDGTRTYRWSSHYERIWDGSQWVNYLSNNDADKISFESAQIIYRLNKNDCTFSLFNPVNKTLSVDSFTNSLAIDGVGVPLSVCDITNIDSQPDVMKITVIRSGDGGELKTMFDLNPTGAVEWTYELSNKEMFTSKNFTITEQCLKCEPEKIKGDIIYFKDYNLDTKNSTHNSLKSIESNTDLNLVYESKNVGFFDKAIIDPVFSSNNPTMDAYIISNSQTGASCSATASSTSSSATTLDIRVGDSGVNTDCRRAFIEWDITSISDAGTVTNSVLKFDVASVTSGRNCDYNEMNTRPSTATSQQQWDDIGDGTTFVNDDATCATVGDNKSIDLGTTADSDVQGQLGSNWWAVGIKFDSESRPAGTSPLVRLAAEEDGTATPKPTLEITYTDAPINFEVSIVDSIVGDTARINGDISVITPPPANITGINFYVNGTLTNTNSTIHNQTAPYTINFGPLWYRMTTGDVYNFTVTASVQNTTQTISNSSSIFDTREYAPAYIDAIVTAEGDVNYTGIEGVLTVNRIVDDPANLTETWNIECAFRDWASVFLNNTDVTWINQSNVGHYRTANPTAGVDYYVSCYNQNLLFGDFLVTGNFSNYIIPGLVIFDQLGGFLGAPSVLLFILAIFSWGTGRNFPIVIIIGVSALGLMGALGLLVLEEQWWGMIFVISGIAILGIRKFF